MITLPSLRALQPCSVKDDRYFCTFFQQQVSFFTSLHAREIWTEDCWLPQKYLHSFFQACMWFFFLFLGSNPSSSFSISRAKNFNRIGVRQQNWPTSHGEAATADRQAWKITHTFFWEIPQRKKYLITRLACRPERESRAETDRKESHCQ